MFLNGLDPCQIQARPFVTYLPLFVSLALTDSSQCGSQQILTGSALPGGWPGRCSSLHCLCSCFMGLSWAKTQRGSWGGGTCQVVGKRPETLVDTQKPINSLPVKVRKVRQPFLCPTSLPFRLHAVLSLLVFFFQDVFQGNFC